MHLAIFYLDYTVLKLSILPNQYFMYAATCVMLAGTINFIQNSYFKKKNK